LRDLRFTDAITWLKASGQNHVSELIRDFIRQAPALDGLPADCRFLTTVLHEQKLQRLLLPIQAFC
jgi:hypothetical protein